MRSLEGIAQGSPSPSGLAYKEQFVNLWSKMADGVAGAIAGYLDAGHLNHARKGTQS